MDNVAIITKQPFFFLLRNDGTLALSSGLRRTAPSWKVGVHVSYHAPKNLLAQRSLRKILTKNLAMWGKWEGVEVEVHHPHRFRDSSSAYPLPCGKFISSTHFTLAAIKLSDWVTRRGTHFSFW